MPPRLVSVIIPVRNAAELIDGQLEALARQDYSEEFETVVSDNGSTDGLAAHLADHPPTDRLTLRCVDSSGGRGMAYARNVGIAAAQGDFLAFCDGDDQVHADWLTELVRAADGFDAVGGAVDITTLNSPEVASWRALPERHERFGADEFLPYAIGCNFGAWRSSLEMIGGFDPTFTDGADDVATSWRLQLAGMTLGHAPDALVAYRFRDTYRGTWDQSSRYGRNSVLLHLAFRDYGHTRRSMRAFGMSVLGLVLFNPLVPRFVARAPRGLWVSETAFLVGRLRAAWKQRIFYV
ncbi:glycosyltransferase [Prescottella agglutinans]|uniref:Glycosyltransferase involved in cell wall biosynthesis n=1 Tax=Prescottella agglutinans TaxID=1644129 RepID=A0ABT6MBE1_9NOCA|nr:glycosyltransferase [Prescottella agglutinans]MDH6281623.1 glycosyltransferase involved in cell wall biosynthesis [Prescottella agglutinans]